MILGGLDRQPANESTTLRLWGVRRHDGHYVGVSGEPEAAKLLADDPELIAAVVWRDVSVGPWLPNASLGRCTRCLEPHGAPHADSCRHRGKNVGDVVN